MAKTDYQNIDQYHKAFDGVVRQRMQTIREIIHKVAPGVEEVISYQIPAFRIGKQFLIYYSAYAKHISLSSPWSDVLLKEFEKELEGLKVSRSAIQFQNDKPLPVGFIQKLVKFRKKEIGQE